MDDTRAVKFSGEMFNKLRSLAVLNKNEQGAILFAEKQGQDIIPVRLFQRDRFIKYSSPEHLSWYVQSILDIITIAKYKIAILVHTHPTVFGDCELSFPDRDSLIGWHLLGEMYGKHILGGIASYSDVAVRNVVNTGNELIAHRLNTMVDGKLRKMNSDDCSLIKNCGNKIFFETKNLLDKF